MAYEFAEQTKLPEATALRDGPSTRLYAEVTGMLHRFTDAVDDTTFELPSTREETEQALRLALVAMTEAQKRIERQEQRIRDLESLSQTDELTGLANRRGFDHALGRALAHAKRARLGGVLLMIDLDHFKDVNDTYGHAAGDALLQAVGTALLDEVRETDTVARIGGDEFVVLMPDLDPKAASLRAHALSQRLNRESIAWRGGTLRIQASVGSVAFEHDLDNADEVMDLADREMYRVKADRKTGRAA